MDASKRRFGPNDLALVFAGADRVLVAKGKQVLEFEPAAPDFDAATFASAVLGPSGNLRAPSLRLGSTWLVGFSEPAYAGKLRR